MLYTLRSDGAEDSTNQMRKSGRLLHEQLDHENKTQTNSLLYIQ